MNNTTSQSVAHKSSAHNKRSELRIFLFITLILGPLTMIAGVGGYGLIIWLSQSF